MEPKQTPKKPALPRLTIRLTPAVHKALKILAAEQSTTVQALVQPAIDALTSKK